MGFLADSVHRLFPLLSPDKHKRFKTTSEQQHG